jgi:hypothetical protein
MEVNELFLGSEKDTFTSGSAAISSALSESS